MKTHILVIGRNAEILQTVVRLVNNNDQWEATGATTDNDAINAFGTRPFKLVLLCNGIDPESEDTLRAAFQAVNPDVVIIQHYGGGSGLLAAEIYQALG